MIRRLLPVFLVCLTFLATGCAAKHAMTPEEFMGYCAMQSTGIYVCDNMQMCGEFSAVLSTDQQSLDECLVQCKAVNDNQMRNADATSYCWYVTSNGNTLCERGCREKFNQ